VSIEQTLRRLEHHLVELASWQDLARLNFEPGIFTGIDGERSSIALGQSWPSRGVPILMDFEMTVPVAWAGKPVFAYIHTGGEGQLTVNDQLIGGLNIFHKEHRILERAVGGETLRVQIEAVPKNLFGTPAYDPKLEVAYLYVPDFEVRGFVEDLAAAHDAATHLHAHQRSEVAQLILDALNKTLEHLGIPRAPTENYLARVIQEPRGAAIITGVWDEWKFEAAPLELPESVRSELSSRRAELKSSLEQIQTRYPSIGKLHLTGHAHIDLAWLWPFEETRRKLRRTFGTILSLMDRYPEFRFNQSSAQAYAFVEQDDPELFEHVKARVLEGRWDITGGMWVEPDGNLLSGESWVRQVLYGQRYFQSRFGKKVHVCWLPDTFGYTANLPQILQGADIPFFFTTKLNWNETNAFPHDLYTWEGIDGSRVIAHSFFNPGQGYNGNIDAHDTLGTWKNFKGKRHHNTSLYSIGWGDGGGGPTQDMLERYERIKDFPALPKLEFGMIEDHFRRIEKETRDLPVWVGEQYLELHRGTYTTQAKIKWYHRRLEHVLVEAETACALAWQFVGDMYPHAELDEAWTSLLRHQFHDVLPGSSVRAVYDAAQKEMGAMLTKVEMLRTRALESLSLQVRGENQIVVWNLTLEDRPLRVRVANPSTVNPKTENFKLVNANGLEVAHQISGDDILIDDSSLIPGLGYVALNVVSGEFATSSSELYSTDNTLENAHLRIAVGKDGTLESVYDKHANRESLAGRGNQIWAYTDIPRIYDAWEIDADHARDGQELLATHAPILGQSGLLEAGIKVRREFNGAVIEQTYSLGANSKRLEVKTRIRWTGRRTMIRALFPLNVRSYEAWFETAFGAIARPTHRNTSWDQAKFEVNAHRWADLSEAGYGVSLLNDGKYGHSAHGSTLGLTLLRSPIFPDPIADEDEHEFTYAILPHQGDWRSSITEAHDLNAPLQAVHVTSSRGDWPSSQHFAKLDAPGLRLSACKKSEDGNEIILRVYEAHGGRGTATLETKFGRDRAAMTNLLEEETETLEIVDGTLEFDFRPFEVKTIRLG
jgi:alpha-mannosidase